MSDLVVGDVDLFECLISRHVIINNVTKAYTRIISTKSQVPTKLWNCEVSLTCWEVERKRYGACVPGARVSRT